MSEFNYCLVKKNKIYEQIQDMLDEEDISMNNINHNFKVQNELGKIIKKANFIQLSNVFNTSDELLEQIFVDITENNKQEGMQGNTIFLFANTKYSFEVIYLEDLNKKQTDVNLNEFATITNMELEPIFNDCAIVKIGYESGSHIHKKINQDDIIEIIVNCFYHKGVLVQEDGSIKELEYSGDNPCLMLGLSFKMQASFQLLGLHFVPYIEPSDKINEKASKIFGNEIKGRVFFIVLSPVNGKKFWNLDKEGFEMIYSILQDEEKVKKIDDEIDIEKKAVNPFFLIKKYCI